MHFLDHVLRTRSHLSRGWDERWNGLLGRRDFAGLAGLIGLYPETVAAAAALADVSGYTRHVIPKKSGRLRVLLEPLEPLKTVQAAVARWVDSAAPPHPAAHGFVPGHSTVTHARVHSRHRFVVSMDVRNFFDSTTHLHLDEALTRRLPSLSPEIRRAIVQIATVPDPTQWWPYRLTNVQIAFRLLAPYLRSTAEQEWEAHLAFVTRVAASSRRPAVPRTAATRLVDAGRLNNLSEAKDLLEFGRVLLRSPWSTSEAWQVFLMIERGRDAFDGPVPRSLEGLARALKRLDIAVPECVSGAFLEALALELDRRWSRLSSAVFRLRRLRTGRAAAWPVIRIKPGLAIGVHALQNTVIAHESLGWRVLPQGSPCSPALSNLVAMDLDEECAELARAGGLAYSRYADDLTFSGEWVPDRLVGDVARILEGRGYRLAREKTRQRGAWQAQVVTGIVVNDTLRPTRLDVRTLRAILHRFDQGKPATIPPKPGQKGPPVEATAAQVLGYLSYLRMIAPDRHERLVQKSTWAASRLQK